MRLYKRYKTWWIRYKINGRTVRQSTHLHDENAARAVLASMQIARGGKVPREAVAAMLDAIYGTAEAPAPTGIPIESIWSVYAETAHATGMDAVGADTWRKRAGRVRALVKWIQDCRPFIQTADQVDGTTASAYASALIADGKADKTRQHAISDLSTVWRTLEKTDTRIRNPWTGLRPRNVDGETLEAFTREQEQAVMSAAESAGHAWKLACLISRHTGLRYGSCASLKWSEIDFKDGIIRHRPPKTLRHGIEVVVPIETEHLLPALLEEAKRPKAGDDFDEYVLREHALYYQMSGHSKMPVQFASVLAAAGISGNYTFHSWRHTFRTRLSEAKVDMETAKELAGHTTDEMSRHYDHDPHLDAKRAAITAAAK